MTRQSKSARNHARAHDTTERRKGRPPAAKTRRFQAAEAGISLSEARRRHTRRKISVRPKI